MPQTPEFNNPQEEFSSEEDRRERIFISPQQVEQLGYSRVVDQAKITYYLNNDFLAKITALSLGLEIEELSKYCNNEQFFKPYMRETQKNVHTGKLLKQTHDQLSSENKVEIEKKLEAYKQQKEFFEELSLASDPVRFLGNKPYDVNRSFAAKGQSGDDLHSWIRELCHQYHTFEYFAEENSTTYKALTEDFDRFDREWNEKHSGEKVPEWLYYASFPSYFVFEKFKDTHGALPKDIQEKIVAEIEEHFKQLKQENNEGKR